jgi:hypothetical protein
MSVQLGFYTPSLFFCIPSTIPVQYKLLKSERKIVQSGLENLHKHRS